MAAALTATAVAGEAPVMMSSKQVIPPPAPECHLQWFIGASGGYLTDVEEDMYHLQFGVEKVCPDKCCTHALYLEVGYVDFDESFSLDVNDDPIDFDLDTQIIPLTLNYKYECNLMDNFNWYIGAGAGIAFVDVDADIDNGIDSISDSFDDEVFYAQIFTGLVYNFSENVELFGGVRYIFMDEPDISGDSDFDERFSIDEDFLFELGLRYNF